MRSRSICHQARPYGNPSCSSDSGASGNTNRARAASSGRRSKKAAPSGTKSSPGAPNPWQSTTVSSRTPEPAWSTRHGSEPSVVVNCTRLQYQTAQQPGRTKSYAETECPCRSGFASHAGRFGKAGSKRGARAAKPLDCAAPRRLTNFGRVSYLPLVLDFDDPRLGGLGLRERDGEHAVDVTGLRFAAVDRGGKNKRAAEQAVTAFSSQVIFTFGLFLRLAFGLDRERVAFQLDFNVLRRMAWKVKLYLDCVLCLDNVRRGGRGSQLRKTSSREISNEIVKFRAQRQCRAEGNELRPTEWIPPSIHFFYLHSARLQAPVLFESTAMIQENHSKRTVKAAENPRVDGHLLIFVSGEPGGRSAAGAAVAERNREQDSCDKSTGVGPPSDAARETRSSAELQASVEQLHQEPEAEVDEGRNLHEPGDEEQRHQGDDSASREHHEVRAENSSDGPRGAYRRHDRAWAEEGQGQRRDHPGQQIEQQEAQVTEAVFHVVAEDPKVEHVPSDVSPASVQEHRAKQRKEAPRVERGAAEVNPGHEASGNESEDLDHSVQVGSKLQLLQKHEGVHRDKRDRDHRRRARAYGVPDRDHLAALVSLMLPRTRSNRYAIAPAKGSRAAAAMNGLTFLTGVRCELTLRVGV